MGTGTKDIFPERRFEFRVLVEQGEPGTPKLPVTLVALSARKDDAYDVALASENVIHRSGWQPELSCESDAERSSMKVVIRRSDAGSLIEPSNLGGDAAAAVTANPSLALDGIGSADDVLFRVTFENREVKVNGFTVSRPQFNSENDLVFEHIFLHPNRTIEVEELEGVKGKPLNKSIPQILRDLGFKGEIRKLFFLGAGKSAVHFVNPITRGDFERRGLVAPRLFSQDGERKKEKL